MKKIFVTIAFALASLSIMHADDKAVTFNQLPKKAQEFIRQYYPNEKVSYASVDDDIIAPEYQVALVGGIMLQFESSGKLDNIETRNGNIPAGIIPERIAATAKEHFPDAIIIGYDIDRKSYEIKLSNRMEMTFDSHFNLVEIDD
jgi:hypothetical protein